MKRSTDKILTTHVGSLPYEGNDVRWVVETQRGLGLDLVNEGEYTKGGDWLSYVETRFGGFEPRTPPPGTLPLIAQGRDREAFADFCAAMVARYAPAPADLWAQAPLPDLENA